MGRLQASAFGVAVLVAIHGLPSAPVAVRAVVHAAQPTPRTSAPVERFKVQTGYPHGRPGYVVDHIVPLCAGGPNDPVNMQWQTHDASLTKDAFERELCTYLRALGLTLKPLRPGESAPALREDISDFEVGRQ